VHSGTIASITSFWKVWVVSTIPVWLVMKASALRKVLWSYTIRLLPRLELLGRILRLLLVEEAFDGGIGGVAVSVLVDSHVEFWVAIRGGHCA